MSSKWPKIIFKYILVKLESLALKCNKVNLYFDWFGQWFFEILQIKYKNDKMLNFLIFMLDLKNLKKS